MKTIEKSIEVEAPLSTVYNQWTQFEEFPRFMEGIEEVQQLSDHRLHWRARLAGRIKEWDAEILEQVPDEKISWRSVGGEENSGVVHFRALDADKTQVTLKLSYQPEGTAEKVGDALGIVGGRIEGDLRRFKEFIETRRQETGAWRGEIHAAGTGGSSGASTEPRSRRLRTI